MTLEQFSHIAHSKIEVRSGYNGKLLAARYNANKHDNLSVREISAVWPEIKATKSGGFENYATPIICVYLNGSVEYEKDHKD